jgi:hypothetical protein
LPFAPGKPHVKVSLRYAVGAEQVEADGLAVELVDVVDVVDVVLDVEPDVVLENKDDVEVVGEAVLGEQSVQS